MKAVCLYWVLFVLLLFKTNIIFTYCFCQPKKKEFGPAFIDRILIGPVLKEAVTQSEIDCQYQCHFHDFCLMYNYNIKTSLCKLLDGRSTNFEIVYKRTWMFKTLKCEKNPCKNQGVCYMNREAKCLCQCSWSGDLCEVPITDNRDKYLISFPRKSTEDYLVLDTKFASVDKFTISLWLQVDPSAPSPYSVFSYATSDALNNDILVFINQKVLFFLGNQWIQFDEAVNDGQWYHLCFLWRSIDGQLTLYIDGIKKGETVLKAGYVIKPGTLVIGQDQDVVKGGFDANQALQGNVTSVNMWDRLLTQDEISDISISCPNENGNLVKWDDLKGTRSGDLEENCSFSFCHT